MAGVNRWVLRTLLSTTTADHPNHPRHRNLTMSFNTPQHILEASVCALATQHSMIQNPRRLEAPGYAFNSLFIDALCQDYPAIMLHNPQFPVHISEVDFKDHDPDQSYHDANASGVFVDNAIVIPHIVVRAIALEEIRELLAASGIRTTQEVISMLAATKKHPDATQWTFHLLEVYKLEALLFIESKRGPPRSLNNIEDYCVTVDDLLELARVQVESQAACAFVCPRLPGQTTIPLVVVCGEYWKFAIALKGPKFAWNESEYFQLARDWGARLTRMAEKDTNAMLPPLKDLLDFFAGSTEQDAPLPAKQQEEMVNLERALRAERRAQLKSREAPVITGPNPNPYMQPYTNKELDTFWMNRTSEPFLEPKPEKGAKLKYNTWTRPMRFGTPASDAWLKYLHMYCARQGKIEQDRRNKEF
uniref:Uncharacterized protein n=1 Tax=Mycena chlorophos TaxID=658473 RepID=A0ABQ0LL87_MYCCL|nr:predicted protein [Mycena chlorophos]